ncbi:GyrI-like domain-containing protein [Chloroflexota bacterium]
MSYECEVKEQSTQPTLSIRTRTPVQDIPQVLGKAYGAIAQYLGELGEQPAGPPFTAYYNMDMQNLDIEIGFPVSQRFADKDDIQASEIPCGKVATCLYTGPYNEMEPAYNALSQWIKDNGYETTGVAYEMYLNDPAQTPPHELQTRIAFLLKTT